MIAPTITLIENELNKTNSDPIILTKLFNNIITNKIEIIHLYNTLQKPFVDLVVYTVYLINEITILSTKMSTQYEKEIKDKCNQLLILWKEIM